MHFSKIPTCLWFNETGQLLRSTDIVTHTVAFYLMTCDHANIIGLYYLPFETMAHQMNISNESALTALQRLSDIEFAEYDLASRTVWVPEMAQYQIGDTIKIGGTHWKTILKELRKYKGTPFYPKFYQRYGRQYCLPEPQEFNPSNSNSIH